MPIAPTARAYGSRSVPLNGKAKVSSPAADNKDGTTAPGTGAETILRTAVCAN